MRRLYTLPASALVTVLTLLGNSQKAAALVAPVSRAALASHADAVVVAMVGPAAVVDESGQLDLWTRAPLHIERVPSASGARLTPPQT